MKTHHPIKPVIVALLGLLALPPAQAELVNDNWVVKSGDGLYGIARKLAPKDLKMQARIRDDIVRLNPGINPSNLEIGQNLKLPDFLFAKPEPAPAPVVKPAIVPAPPAPVQVSQPARVTPDPEDVIGKVVIQSGSMVAENRGTTRKLNRSASILKGDTLKTAGNARSQVRLKDGALIAIAPGTELKFEDFAFNGREDGTERSIINLIRGGFRTITGAIGHTNKQNYQVKTSIATIGIRGTHYGLMLCEAGSCQNNPEAGNLNDGLYGGVVDGSIITENDAGPATFNNDQYFHIQSAQTLPVETLLPPPIFNDAPAGGPGPEGNGNPPPGPNGQPGPNGMGPRPDGTPPGPGDGMMAGQFRFNHNPMMMNFIQGTNFLPPKDNLSFDPNQPPPQDLSQNLPRPAPVGSGLAISMTLRDTTANVMDGVAAPILVMDGNKNQIFLEQQVIGTQTINNLPFGIHEEHLDADMVTYQTHDLVRLPKDASGAVYENLGGSPLGVNWGRWHGSYVLTEKEWDVANPAVVTTTPLQHDAYAHFIYSDRVTAPTLLSGLGGLKTRIEFYDFKGGTNPTLTSYSNNQFNTAAPIPLGKPVEIAVMLDFVSQTMLNYKLSIQDTSQNLWEAYTLSPISFAALKEDFSLTGSSPQDILNGYASLTFLGDQAGAAMTSYALWYSDVANSIDYGVNGAGVLAPVGVATGNGSVGLFAAADPYTAQLSFSVHPDNTAASRDNLYIANAPNNPAIATDDVLAPVLAIGDYVDSVQNNTFAANPSQAMAAVSPSASVGGATVYWGHWDTASLNENTASLTGVTAHFIGSNAYLTTAQLGGLTALGTQTYSVANTGTAFDASVTASGITSAASSVAINLTADFALQRVTSFGVNVDGLSGVLYENFGSNFVPFANLNQSIPLVNSVNCTGCQDRGVADLQFVGSQAEGAITSFALSDGVTSAAGVALLAR